MVTLPKYIWYGIYHSSTYPGCRWGVCVGLACTVVGFMIKKDTVALVQKHYVS